MRVTVEGAAHAPRPPRGLQRGTPCIVVSNHRTYYDPFLINLVLRTPVSWIGASFLNDIPVIRRLSRMAGTILVSPSGRTSGEAMETILEACRTGAVGFFPEGYQPLIRMRAAGRLGQFNRGFAYFSARSGTPVLPISIVPAEEDTRRYPVPPALRWFFQARDDFRSLQRRIVYRRVTVVIHPLQPPPGGIERRTLAEYRDHLRGMILEPLRLQEHRRATRALHSGAPGTAPHTTDSTATDPHTTDSTNTTHTRTS